MNSKQELIKLIEESIYLLTLALEDEDHYSASLTYVREVKHKLNK